MTGFTRLYIQAKESARRLADDEGGATAIEYGLIAALIAVAILGTLGTIGTDLNNIFTQISNSIAGQTN